MFCEKCGNQLTDEHRFCDKCGHELQIITSKYNDATDFFEDETVGRLFMIIDDRDWKRADQLCDDLLNRDYKNGKLYLAKLMIKCKVTKIQDVTKYKKTLVTDNHFRKACMFLEGDLAEQLKQYGEIQNYIYSKVKIPLHNILTAVFAALSFVFLVLILLVYLYIKKFSELTGYVFYASAASFDNILYVALSVLFAIFLILAILFILNIKSKKRKLYAKYCKDNYNTNVTEHFKRFKEYNDSKNIKINKHKKRFCVFCLPILSIIIVFTFVFSMVIVPYHKYNKAIDDIENEDYATAYLALKELGDYKQAEIIAHDIRFSAFKQIILNADIGDTVFLGTKEQDYNLSNGEEDIEWIVLDKQDDKILVISKYITDTYQHPVVYKDPTVTKEVNIMLQNIDSCFNDDEINLISTDKTQEYYNDWVFIQGQENSIQKVFFA